MGKKLDRFFHLDESVYYAEICAMGEERLRAEHKTIQQAYLSASAGAGASGAAGLFFLPALGLTAVNARRVNVNYRQMGLIERRLAEKGWTGHKMSGMDLVIGAGPCIAAELIIPAGGAIVGQAVHHVGTVATGHAAGAAAQHAGQAAGQHVAQLATENAAQQIATHAPIASMAAVLNQSSAFFHSALQGAGSEVFTASRGALGHASAQYFASLPGDLATAQAQVLGTAAGQIATAEAAKEALRKAASYGTEYFLKGALDSKEKKSTVIITTTEVIDPSIALSEAHQRAAEHLLDQFYHGTGMYYKNGRRKNKFKDISACTQKACKCKDYNDALQKSAKESPSSRCMCGHLCSQHSRKGAKNVHVVKAFCEVWYKRFEHYDGDEKKKRKLSQIEACEDCDCRDYDCVLGTDREDGYPDCKCGCDWIQHSFYNIEEEEKRAWVLGVVAVGYLEFLVDA